MMTMNMYQRTIPDDGITSNSRTTSPTSGEICRQPASVISKKTQRTVKRSFDVAFLMAPDDQSKKREHRLQLKKQLQLMQQYQHQVAIVDSATKFSEASPLPAPIDLYQKQLIQQSDMNPLNFSVDADSKFRFGKEYTNDAIERQKSDYASRSAFTKFEPAAQTVLIPAMPLSPSSVSSTASYGSALSPPDLTYQDSLSPRSYTPNNNGSSNSSNNNNNNSSGSNRSPIQLGCESKTLTIPSISPLSHSPALPASSPTAVSRVLSPSAIATQQNSVTSILSPIAAVPGFQYLLTTQLNNGNQKGEKMTGTNACGKQHKQTAMNAGRKEYASTPSSPKDAKTGASGFSFPTESATAASLTIPYGGAFAMTSSFPFAAAANPISFPTAAAAAAANITAALLPSSLAALTLPAQNICAKCNMNFRMTSDLVYHMRSHHKNEHAIADPYKKRREQDKLKCPVCNESFRERHHLTRHMTAHQDKDSDEDMVNRELAAINNAGSRKSSQQFNAAK